MKSNLDHQKEVVFFPIECCVQFQLFVRRAVIGIYFGADAEMPLASVLHTPHWKPKADDSILKLSVLDSGRIMKLLREM